MPSTCRSIIVTVKKRRKGMLQHKERKGRLQLISCLSTPAQVVREPHHKPISTINHASYGQLTRTGRVR